MAKVMIVDDSAVIRRHIRIMLERGGHEVVHEASDGRELLSAYVNHRPDVVTLDIGMPVMDGVEALELLLKTFPDALVIMISAHGEKQQVLKAAVTGAKSYLVKPFDAEQLLNKVNMVLQT